jgi:hypothetical protein
MKKENLLGRKFVRLLVIAEAEPVGARRRSAWLCQCDCGNQKIVKTDELKGGGTQSCGCLNKELNIGRGHQMGASNVQFHPSETSARRVWKKRYSDGDLSFEDFLRLSQMDCCYCGAKPNNTQNAAMEDKKASQFAKDNGDFVYNGLDRIDSSLPHTLDNVVPCCKWCNFAKRERSVVEFEIWAEQLYQTLQKRKGP